MAGILAGVDQRTQLAGHNRLEMLLFGLGGGQRYGINVFKVQEVIQCPPLTHVPNAHPVVRGIANMRGKTLTIMDLSMAIGGPPQPDCEHKFVVVTEYNRSVQGFLVDSVDRIVNVNWQEMKPPPRGAGEGSYLTAVTQLDGKLVEILDVEKVLSEVVGCEEEVSSGVIEPLLASKKPHVLVVDDSSVARRQVARVLDQIGVEYTTCQDGEEAWQQLLQWVEEGRDIADFLSMVISDVEMPRMDGYSLTKNIRENPALHGLFVILHTSLSGVFNRSMVAQVGANDFLPKWEPDNLARIVQEYLNRYENERAQVA